MRIVKTFLLATSTTNLGICTKSIRKHAHKLVNITRLISHGVYLVKKKSWLGEIWMNKTRKRTWD